MANDKRYLIFGFDTYYPCGAMNDLITSVDTVEECKEVIDKSSREYHDIYDRIQGCSINTDTLKPYEE